MNTKTAELQILLSDITKAALQQGIVPDFGDISSEVRFQHVGEPQSFDGLNPVVAISSEVNTELAKIEENSAVLDMAASMQTERAMEFSNTFKSSVERMERIYRDLAYRASSLMLMARSGTSALYCISDTFSYLSDIDLANTTAYIDTYRGLAELPFDVYEEEAETGSTNATFSRATVSLGTVSRNIEVGPNTIYTRYDAEVSAGVEMEIQIQATLNDVFQGGRLEFKLDLPDTTKIMSVTGQSSASNIEQLTYFQNGRFVFIPLSNLYRDNTITVRLLKIDHDGEEIHPGTGIVEHQFVFSLSGLAIPNRRYRSTATVQTNPYSLPDSLGSKGISQYKLTSTRLTPGDTSITPYIAFDSGAFRRIQFDTIYRIGETNSGSTVHVGGVSVREAPTPIYKVNGTTQVTTMDGGYLLEGFEQAEVETMEYVDSADDLTYWAKNTGSKCYQNIRDAGIFLTGESSHKIYFNITADSAKEVILTNVGVFIQGNPSMNIANYVKLYFNGQSLNGKTLPDGSKEYMLSVLRGVNNVNILIGLEADISGIMSMGNKLNVPGVTVYVKERKPTSMVALLALEQREKAYAIDDSSIFINYIPPPAARFKHFYTNPTANLPSTVSLQFVLDGVSDTSPQQYDWRLEFSPGLAY